MVKNDGSCVNEDAFWKVFTDVYYEEILQRLDLKPEECVMVGNNFEEDMVPTEKLGIQGFLLTDCLIHKGSQDISAYTQGSFAELKKYLAEKVED